MRGEGFRGLRVSDERIGQATKLISDGSELHIGCVSLSQNLPRNGEAFLSDSQGPTPRRGGLEDRVDQT